MPETMPEWERPAQPLEPRFKLSWVTWTRPRDGTPRDLLQRARWDLGRQRSKVRSVAAKAKQPAIVEACQHDLALLNLEEQRLLERMGLPVATIANEGPW